MCLPLSCASVPCSSLPGELLRLGTPPHRDPRAVGSLGQSALRIGAEVTCGFPLLPGCAMSGLIADAKTLIDKARVETQVRLDVSLLKTPALVSGASAVGRSMQQRNRCGVGGLWGAWLPTWGSCRTSRRSLPRCVFSFLVLNVWWES